MILVDSSVVLDVLGADPVWGAQSTAALDKAKATDRVAAPHIVYAEIAAGFGSLADLDSALAALDLPIESPSRESLFLAGRAFRVYRRRGGPRTSVLPDFLVGAQAMAEGAALLTRDPRRVRTYFPTVQLIAP